MNWIQRLGHLEVVARPNWIRTMGRLRSLKLRWIHGHLTELTWEHTRRLLLHPNSGAWRPAINVFRCDRAYCICVDLAGATKDEIELTIEPGGLLRISGTRAAPEPDSPSGRMVRVLALEIDSGAFERELQLPLDVDFERIAAEQENGLLWIRLPLR